MAERLGSALQKHLQRFESARDLKEKESQIEKGALFYLINVKFATEFFQNA